MREVLVEPMYDEERRHNRGLLLILLPAALLGVLAFVGLVDFTDGLSWRWLVLSVDLGFWTWIIYIASRYVDDRYVRRIYRPHTYPLVEFAFRTLLAGGAFGAVLALVA